MLGHTMGEVRPDAGEAVPEKRAPEKTVRRGPWRLLTRTLAKAWDGNIFSEAAEAAFWQTLSLPPLLLGLLGSVGFIGEWFGQGVVTAVHDRIITFCHTVFSANVVQEIIEPTVNSILTVGKGEIVSVGFVISLWAGSSAMSSFVDAITVAHDQYGVRNEVWQRIFALLLYLCALIGLVIGLPLLAIGPDLLPEFFPLDWRPTVTSWVGALYYPVLGVMIVLALTTLYKLALPRRLPWHRGLPGAILAGVVFLVSSIGLRIYLNWITKTGYTYGALAAPIAFLLLMFFIGLAVVGGAYFNSAIQELWPAKATRRQRRKWRRLEMERATERLRAEEGRRLWDRTTMPLRRPKRHPDEHEEGAPGDVHGAELGQAEPETASETAQFAAPDGPRPPAQERTRPAERPRTAGSGPSSGPEPRNRPSQR